jgi:hypothetical protein
MIAGPADGPPDPADLAGLRDVTIHSLRMGRIADSLASLDAA